jgi:hypothetical protein
MPGADLVNDIPVDGLIAMDSNISESDRFLHSLGEPLTELHPLDTVLYRLARNGRDLHQLVSISTMKRTTATRFDVAEHLWTSEEMATYLEACFEEANGDAAFIAKALGDIARAKGMAQVARDAGLPRER